MQTFNLTNDELIDLMTEKSNDFLDMCEIYGDRKDRRYLRTNVSMSFYNKSELWDIFRNSPYHNGKGQLVLPQEIKRPADRDIINNYSNYIYNLATEATPDATINGKTYSEVVNELRIAKSIVSGIEHMQVPAEDVIVQRKSYHDWYETLNAIETDYNKFYDSEYACAAHDKFVTVEDYNNLRKCRTLANAICSIVENYFTEADGAVIEELLKAFPECQARVGAKVTKVINKCLESSGLTAYAKSTEERKAEFNRQWTRYGDAIKPRTYTRWTVLSINFCDFLSMSHGKSWTSCLNVDKNNILSNGHFGDGFNSRRTLDYALDPTTMVLYTVDSDYNGDDFELQPKNIRQLFHFGEDKLIQSRLYPQDGIAEREVYTQYRETVEQLLAEGMGEANLWSAPNRGTISEDNGVWYSPYEDTDCSDYVDFSTNACHASWEYDSGFNDEVNYVYFRGSDEREHNHRAMQIGSTDAICINCGDELYEDYHERITCYDCY